MKVMIEHEFVTETCASCGCVFALPVEIKRQLKMSKATFYCYNGHGMSYTKSMAEILQEKLTEKERQLADRNCDLLHAKAEIYSLTHPVKRRAKRLPI